MAGNDARVAGRYALHEVLGTGGAGAVWRGHDELLDRPVAVKEVRIAHADPGRNRDRVMREARAAARLNHPNVTAVYDVVADEAAVHIVMELVHGESLADRVRRDGPLAPAEAARLGLAVLDALEAAHRQGIVHRDVKPGNVLLPADGEGPKLTDFGIASLADDAALTMTGTVLGSPSYISPEQASGRPAGPAADLWGLGALLYFAVEGVAPFDRGDPLPTLAAVVNEPPRPPVRAAGLAAVIADLLRKDPAQRPSTREVRAALRAVAGGATVEDPHVAQTQRLVPLPSASREPAPASPDSREAPAPPSPDPRQGASRERAVPRRRAAAPLVVAVVALIGLLGALAVAALLADRAGDRPQAAPTTPQPAAQAPAPTDEPPPEQTEEPATEEPQTEEPETEAPQTEAPQTEEPQTGEAEAAVVPDGWETFAFGPASEARVAHPQGWEEVQVSRTITDLRAPGSSTYLRTDWTDTPAGDPVEDWRRQSQAFGERHENYTELRIEPTTVAGHEAAIWEYTYRSGGVDLRAVNIAIVAGDAAYALNFQTAAAEWEDHGDTLEAILRSFQV